MNDSISRQAAIAAFKPYALYDSNRTNAEWARRIELVLEELPSTEKHGKWISVSHKKNRICSICEGDEPYKFADENENIFAYCPYCGTRMDGE